MNTPLIPRKLLFSNPDISMVQISPDGEMISYLADLDGVSNVWVAPRANPGDARPVTHARGRGVRAYRWTFSPGSLIYLQDKNGDENWRVLRVDLASGQEVDLTPYDGTAAQILMVSPRQPEEIVVALNDRDPQWHDLYAVRLADGQRRLIYHNQRFMEFLVDEDLRLLAAARMKEDGSIDLCKMPAGGAEDGELVLWESIPQEDALTTGFAGVDKTGAHGYLKDSRGRDTSALYLKELETGRTMLLAEDDQVDAQDVVIHPTQKHVQAVSFVYDRKYWQVLDLDFEADLEALRQATSGDVEINSRSLDDRYWIVVYVSDTSPLRYYLYEREKRRVTFLFTNRKALAGYPMARLHPVVIEAGDGLKLVSYYTLPPGSDTDDDGIPDQPAPLVICPHGGPWWRDTWGFDIWRQWLANRGYAVLNVNFRCSTGFGKAFINAGDMQWGERVIQDQVDAVAWAVRRGIADPRRVAIMGGSFGGYSTLAGLTFYPDFYTCGVDLVGPSNLITLLQSVPPYWKPMLELFTRRVGDHRTEEGRALLKAHSPLTHVDRIRKPLMIGQGANDPRVAQAESDQIVSAMQARGIPVTYLLYPDEGHGFARPENNLSFFAAAEAFLARCLGGRCEPIGSDLHNSSIQVIAGADGAPGLSEAIAQAP